ncbi:hypothetical protein GCM10009777_17140 [Microbacterium pumilum]|uniref:Uncharacterized protein n=1 Tax=Microbacterium pumilum TaxID=344165 RepID=A0ABN2SC21_9MICO
MILVGVLGSPGEDGGAEGLGEAVPRGTRLRRSFGGRERSESRRYAGPAEAEEWRRFSYDSIRGRVSPAAPRTSEVLAMAT